VGRRFLDVTLENLPEAPPEVLSALYWEMDTDQDPPDPGFEKEEWFSQVLLEWGTCATLAREEEMGTVAFAEYAPPSFFPRLGRFRSGSVSADAVYLAYCYVVSRRRGFGVGTELIRAVGRQVLDRGIRAVEAIGDRGRADGWVLPAPFLAANGFQVVREDPRYPLMRLDLRTAVLPREAVEAAAAPVPAPGVA
jgi:GNAT superfamily N-acetyltransferase